MDYITKDDRKGLNKVIKQNMEKNCNIRNYTHEELLYYSKLDDEEREKINEFENNKRKRRNRQPLRFKIIVSNLSVDVKESILNKMNALSSMSDCSSDYHKLSNYIRCVSYIPFDIIKKIQYNNNISQCIYNVYNTMNNRVYGQKETKEQLIRIVAQWIKTDKSKGNVIGIHGPPGVGKTELIKNGLSRALKLPFCFIPLGGVEDSSYLTGHSYTYEGSQMGKIVSSLVESRCMNPIMYFDELDKVSTTDKGEDIINTLIHITDETQNNHFIDKYMSEIPIDLSNILFIFTFNNKDKISPILLDRMKLIEIKRYTKEDKLIIAKKHLIPRLLKDFNFMAKDCVFSDEIIEYIIERTTEEQGVRNLKRSLEGIISNINLLRLLRKSLKNKEGGDLTIAKWKIHKFPIKVNKEIVNSILKEKEVNESLNHLYI